jgi:hypothetical protein
MRIIYIFLAIIAVLMYNIALAKRDQEMFKAYDTMCQEQPQNPKCRYSK